MPSNLVHVKVDMAEMLVFLSPLDKEVWLCLGLAFIVVTLAVYFIERYIYFMDRS